MLECCVHGLVISWDFWLHQNLLSNLCWKFTSIAESHRKISNNRCCYLQSHILWSYLSRTNTTLHHHERCICCTHLNPCPDAYTQTEKHGPKTSTNCPLLLDHLINPVLGQGVWTDLLQRETSIGTASMNDTHIHSYNWIIIEEWVQLLKLMNTEKNMIMRRKLFVYRDVSLK